jgi:hypothetical protein
MPFTTEDVDKHIKGLDPKQKEQWVEVANSALAKCEKEGGAECDASAIRQANGVVKKNSKDFEHNQTFNIEGVEIFAIGKWNGDNFTEQDLKGIVEASTEVGFDPPVTTDHKQGGPALGWGEQIKFKAGKLVADLSKLPLKLYEAIKRENYKRISVELYSNYTQNGKTWPYVLKAITFLGADIPAVPTLEAISSLYSDDSGKYKWYEYTKTAENKDNGDTKFNKKGGEQMKEKNDTIEVDVKIYQDTITELKSKVETFSSENTELKGELETTNDKLKSVTAEKEDIAKQLKEFADKAVKEKAERKEAETKAFCDQLVKDGKLAPASKTKVFDSLMNSDTETKVHDFKDADGNTSKQTQYEMLKHIFSQGKKVIDFSEVCPDNKNESETIDDNAKASDELDKKTKAYMAEHNIKSYAEAWNSVKELNPELVKRYNSEASKG